MRAVHGRRQTDTGDEISLGAVARAVWHNRRVIVGPTLLIAAAAFVAVNLVTPRYKSEARVLVEGRENIFLRPEAEKQLMDRGAVDPETVTSQVQLVLSRDLAREVINELNLTENPEFNAALKEFSPLQVLRSIGILRDPMSMTLEERVLAAYYERLTAFAVDKSWVISIEFQSADPQLAPRIANLIAEKYLTLQQVAKQDQARSASKWLSGELDKLPRIKEMRAQIDDLDRQIRSEGERLARSLENEARVAGARLESLSGTLDQAKRLSASTSEQDVQLRVLEREARAQKDLFES